MLSLAVMTIMVMTVVLIASFLTLESRLTMHHHLATRARLNALVSLKLAMAHLQQEAGPDRRATARAELTQPDANAFGDATHPKLSNPMWTGVWRSDKPDQPPAWLVSGLPNYPANNQSVSLSGATDYPAAHWAPWQPSSSSTNYVDLVGDGSATDAEKVTPNASEPSVTFDKPSGYVKLPKIALPDNNISGNYAYWIGDEGIKTRINLIDSRTTTMANTLGNFTALRSPMNAGYPLLPGLESLTTPAQLALISDINSLAALSGYAPASGQPENSKRLFHDVSLCSSGVIADSLNGGLKRDLSLAFDLGDVDFARTEFGAGSTGAAGTHTENGYESTLMNIPVAGKSVPAAPIFNRIGTDGNVRGPTWWALRDYHGLYKELGWSADGSPSLFARTFFPNVNSLYPTPVSGTDLTVRDRMSTYSDTFAGDQKSPFNPTSNDTGTISGYASRLVPRPVNCAITPYIQRVLMVFSVNYDTFTTGGAAIWLNLTPIVVIHNPYNVALTLQPPTTSGADNYSLAISFAEWNQWTFNYTRYPVSGPKKSFSVTMDIFVASEDDGRSTKMDMFRIYLPNPAGGLTIGPGEQRVFSCSSGMVDWQRVVVLQNEFNQTGGFSDDSPNWTFGSSANWNTTDALGFSMIPKGPFRVRQALACWPGDILQKTTTTADLYRKTSEHTELYYRDMKALRTGSVGEKYFNNYTYIASKFAADKTTPVPPSIITVMELSLKTPADAAVSDPLSGGTIPPAPFPLFTHSNPLAATMRADGAGRTAEGTGLGYVGASPSYRMRLFQPSSWTEVIQTASGQTYGGYSMTTEGSMRVIQTEVPLAPPTSLGQYAHANFGIRDQQPLLSVGNSFASTLVGATRVIQNNGTHWTEYDQNYLLNRALWDGFFLSGAAPKMAKVATPYPPVPTDPSQPLVSTPSSPNPYAETKSLSAVLDDFTNDISPLENPRMRLHRLGRSPDQVRKAIANYRQSASVLFNDGAFNVNSTSVEAWISFLGSAKNHALGNNGSSQPSSTANGRFPRACLISNAAPAQGSMKDSKNWTGFNNLSDDQIRKLAIAIVQENKARFTVLKRNEKDQITPPLPRTFGGRPFGTTPYLGLSEFINRFLCTENWAARCGALQSAIFRADTIYSAKLSNRLSDGGIAGMLGQITQSSVDSSTTVTASQNSNPENIEVGPQGGSNQMHTALSAPGNLLQSDLLATFGSALCTRSDTFVIRAYGDATNDMGVTVQAWIEAAVQRLPDFVDDNDPAESGCAAPKPSTAIAAAGSYAGEAALNPGLTAINRVLGRRFKIISARLLRPNEI